MYLLLYSLKLFVENMTSHTETTVFTAVYITKLKTPRAKYVPIRELLFYFRTIYMMGIINIYFFPKE